MTFRAPFVLVPLLLVACTTKPAQEAPAVSVASASNSARSATAVSVASGAQPPTATSAAPVVSDAERAQKGRAKADAEHQKELARWTPELHATAKRLAETSYASIDAALTAVLASPHRQPGNAERDKFRHPRETLEFFGLQPTSTVLEYGPGSGWYTELLAPALAKRGKLFVTSGDPNGTDQHAAAGYRLKLLLETSPEL